MMKNVPLAAQKRLLARLGATGAAGRPEIRTRDDPGFPDRQDAVTLQGVAFTLILFRNRLPIVFRRPPRGRQGRDPPGNPDKLVAPYS
jgi:hypothetical protein